MASTQYPFRPDPETMERIREAAKSVGDKGISINEWLLRAAERELSRNGKVMSR